MSTYNYEDLQLKIETMNTPESHLLIVHIPEGFTRGDIGAKVEYDFGRVRVFGERSIANTNKRSRFNQIYQVPSYCYTNNIKGKFDGNIITITMPIIPGSKVPTNQELQEQIKQQKEVNEKKNNIPPQSVAETKADSPHQISPEVNKDSSITQKGKQEKEETSPQKEVNEKDNNIPPQSGAETNEDSPHQISPEANKDSSTPPEEANRDSIPQKQHETSQKTTQVTKVDKDSMPQKGQQQEETSSQKETQVTKVESKKEDDHETSTPQEEANKDSIPQKQHETSQKTTQVTKVDKDSMPQKGQQQEETSSQKTTQIKKKDDHETSTPSEEANKDSMPQKGKQEKEASPQSATQVTKVESKREGNYENSAPSEEANKDSMPQKGHEGLNDDERKRVGKEESKEDNLKKTITEKVKEIKEESKVSADKVESVIRNNIEKVKVKFGDDVEKKSDVRGIYESTKTRIKDMADSTTQAVTRLAKRSNNEENKQKIMYTAAAILVVGISVYASFKYRSSRRT